MIKNLLLFLHILLISNLFSQEKYSLEALTGLGGIELVGDVIKLQKDTYEAFQKMQNAARKDGIEIKIVSGYRSFKSQKSIWNRKYNKYISQGLSPRQAIEKIIEYSTIPGTSRHHWGTDIDVIDGLVPIPKSILYEKNYAENGIYSKLKKWMDKNSERYGFYLVYNSNIERKGFKYEPWHYSYKPLSGIMLKEYKEIDLKKFYAKFKPKGFLYFNDGFLNKYFQENIMDINPSLQ